MKSDIFKDELELIKDLDLRTIIINTLNKAPDYFYEIPASSSGKYHPQQDLGYQGTIRHTKTVVWCGVDLVRSEQFVSNNQDCIDIVVASSLIHDAVKNGKENCGRTVTEHPLLAAELFKKEANRVIEFLTRNGIEESYIKQLEKKCNIIEGCIKSHMGIWNKDFKTKKEILPKPKTKFEVLVHLADYIASRKYINMYDMNNNKIN